MRTRLDDKHIPATVPCFVPHVKLSIIMIDYIILLTYKAEKVRPRGGALTTPTVSTLVRQADANEYDQLLARHDDGH